MIEEMHIPRTFPLITILSIVLALGLILLFTKTRAEDPAPGTLSEESQSTFLLAGQTFSVEIVSTPEAQAKGLSGRTTLPEGSGMLFWFSRDDFYPFWMPDMQFSIDILWMDKDWNVVHIEERVAPESYPQTFSSPVPARYVLELPAGTVQNIGIKTGQKGTLSWGNP